MAIRVTLECGHASMLRVRTTPEGYTHDWEVFVRGVDNADISQYIDKVVFNLHETFQKPKRILKEPPYTVKESGYAGFEIPIDVYLKNKDEPKRIQIQYDLHLQQSGPAINNVIRHHEVFVNPSEEFRKKLLKGGGVVSHAEDSAEKGEFKMVPPMVSKPKLSGTDVKKHRMTEVRSSDEFSDLFGNIMTLPAKVSPENKRALSDKIISSKTSVDKSEKIEKSVKQKHSPHKEKKKDKNSDERKDKKDRLLSKEKDRLKEKSKRSQSPVSKEDFSNPSIKKNPLPSPTKKHLAPPIPPANQKPTSPRPKEKQHKKISADKEKEKVKDNFKVPVEEQSFDRKKKKHKEDKNKDRKERDKEKEHDKMKDPSKTAEKKVVKPEKHEKSDKEKSLESKASKEEKKSPKHSKERDKVRSEKSSRSENLDKVKEPHAEREKQKHKHKRKEKKEKKEENVEKEKQEKQKISTDKTRNSFAGLSSANPLSTLLAEMPERDSSDSTHSVDEESMSPAKAFLTPGSEPEVISTPNLCSDIISKQASPRNNIEAKNDGEERTKKEKTKSSRGEDRECRKRKRKADSGADEHVVKREKDREQSLSPSVEPVSSSQSPVSIEINSPYIGKEAAPPQTEILNITESEQVAPDSTNSNFTETEAEGAHVFSEDYVSQLKELQQKIMTLQDNQELQRVVQVIAETGQYEITRKTFDFDLCALDRTTVQRLQQFFSAS